MADTHEQTSDLLELTATIVAAMVSNNTVSAGELPNLIASTHAALASATAPAVPDAAPQEPAVPVRSSVKQDYIVCLEDGAKLKMLKRYLRTRFEMTPEEYRAKWNLPRDYPMVAPAYAEERRGLAKKIGLGLKKAVEADVVAPATKSKPALKGLDAAKAHLNGDAKPVAKKRGRPAKAQQEAQDAPADHDADVVREPIED